MSSAPPKGQLTDSTGALTLARTYDPYGTVNTTNGAGSSSYGYTNEYQSQGLIYLRARHYAPSTGRFLSRDTWSGDANRPLSFNHWGYVEGNPVNRTDPSGLCWIIEDDGDGHWYPDSSVECLQNQRAPTTTGYSEKTSPTGITWISNSIGNIINKKLAPIYNADELIVNTNAAQFQIADHEKYNTLETERMSSKDCADKNGTYDNKHKVCSYYKAHNANFCGQVVLSAILSQLLPAITAKTIADALDIQEGTSAPTLAEYLNTKYAAYVSADYISGKSYESEDFFNLVTNNFSNSTLLAPVVNIVSGNQNLTNPPPDVNGKLGITGGINHWILITGISTQWAAGEESPYNWVRIFNPFDNQAEYYWWPDFKRAWDKPGGNTALRIHMQASP